MKPKNAMGVFNLATIFAVKRPAGVAPELNLKMYTSKGSALTLKSRA